MDLSAKIQIIALCIQIVFIIKINRLRKNTSHLDQKVGACWAILKLLEYFKGTTSEKEKLSEAAFLLLIEMDSIDKKESLHTTPKEKV